MESEKHGDRDTRRSLLKRLALASVGAGLSAATRARSVFGNVSYAGLSSDDFLGEVEVVAQVKDDKIFTEGPTVDAKGHVYFTNVPMSKILRFDPESRELSVFRENSNQTNGMYFDPQGRLLCCEGGTARVTRTEMKTGTIEVLADRFRDKPLAAPNDLCMDSKGRIYFTSRPGAADPEQGNVNAVYRIDPDGQLDQVLHWPDVHMPNGIVLSPDERTLYLIESHAAAEHHRDIRAYDVSDDGSLSGERILIDFYPGRSGDGMCIDAEGNLYVAAGLHTLRKTSETLDTKPGIHVISPDGKLLAFRETPEDTVTNCTFGGADLRSLYITCGTLLLRIQTRIPGKSSYLPLG